MLTLLHRTLYRLALDNDSLCPQYILDETCDFDLELAAEVLSNFKIDQVKVDNLVAQLRQELALRVSEEGAPA